MKQKHYIDIENLRENSTEFVKPNTNAFEKGDLISITEKIDGSNASFAFSDGKLLAFSRKQELSFKNNLAGFWNWAQTLDASEYEEDSQYIYFGEWLRKNKIIYSKEYINRFYLFDIYDKERECWMPQDFVKEEAKKHGLTYVPELYFGPFVSWEHCRTFMNSPAYGDTQEGIVVKNLSKINDKENRFPVYLKMVNESFKESKRPKIIDPEKEAERAKAQSLIESIVTPRRVEKMIFKLRDEGIFPETLTPADMKLVAKNLPKRVYEDCMKEEKEILLAAGENSGKMVSSTTMKIARNLILGK